MSDYDDPRYHSEPKGMLGAMTADELGSAWRVGEVRYYDPVVNAGCCYCLSKTWRRCRFPGRLCRIGNASVRLDSP